MKLDKLTVKSQELLQSAHEKARSKNHAAIEPVHFLNGLVAEREGVGTAILKKIGADMREGKMTLPLIYALQQAPAAEREKMKKIVADPDFTDADFQELVSCLDRFGGLEYTRKLAADHLETAKAALDIFDDGETKTTMLMLTDYVLKRSV